MKRFAAILLAGILSVSAVVPSFAAVNTNADFWAVSSMEYGYEAGLLTETELQKAKSPMSRLEFCRIVVRFLETVTGEEKTATQPTPFRDCNDADVIAAYEAGIIGGVEEGVFAPDRTLTREQMAIMEGRVLRAVGIDLTDTARKNPFSDTGELYASSNKYIDELYGAEIISGYDDGTFGPFREMTVQEAVVSFVRAYKYVEGAEMLPPAEEPEGSAPENPEQPEGTLPVTPEQPEVQPVPPVEENWDTETVSVGGKEISLGWTAAELQAVWGEPDRIDESVYGLDRYIYINEYIDYFFATFDKGEIVEIFVPVKDFSYLGMDGNGTSADIKNLAYVSSIEHSGVIFNEESEARLPLDYEGNICALLLQTKDFVHNKNPKSTLQFTMKEDIEAQLLDLIQVRRTEEGKPLLIWDKRLAKVAREHSEDMTSNSYFDYNSKDGTTPFGRIMEEGKNFFTASETIARQRDDVVNIYQEWMRSISKHAALMDSSMQEVGVGVSSRMKVLHVTVDLCGQMPETKK